MELYQEYSKFNQDYPSPMAKKEAAPISLGKSKTIFHLESN